MTMRRQACRARARYVEAPVTMRERYHREAERPCGFCRTATPSTDQLRTRNTACAVATGALRSDCHASIRTLVTRRPWRVTMPRAWVSTGAPERRKSTVNV